MNSIKIGFACSLCMELDSLLETFGQEFDILREYNVSTKLFVPRSQRGKGVHFNGGAVVAEVLDAVAMAHCDLLFFIPNSEAVVNAVKDVAGNGCVCVELFARRISDGFSDNTYLSGISDNNDLQAFFASHSSFSLPCGDAIIIGKVLGALNMSFKIKSCICNSYSSVSRYGQFGLDMLRKESEEFFASPYGLGFESELFVAKAGFNVVNLIGELCGDETVEEEKVKIDLERLFGNSFSLDVSLTLVPVFVGESYSLTIFFTDDLAGEISVLEDSLILCGAIEYYPACDSEQSEVVITPREVHGGLSVAVSRLKKSRVGDNVVSCFVVADSLKQVSYEAFMVLKEFCVFKASN